MLTGTLSLNTNSLCIVYCHLRDMQCPVYLYGTWNTGEGIFRTRKHNSFCVPMNQYLGINVKSCFY